MTTGDATQIRSMSTGATLHFVAGKLASGKTTLARRLARKLDAIIISEDVWMSKLFEAPIVDFPDYLARSARFRNALGPHLRDLLSRGVSVVLDFGGNVPRERAWVKGLCPPGAGVILHYLRASDELCKERLHRRNTELPEGAQATTEAEFDAITKHFVPPHPREGFDVTEYDADRLAESAEPPDPRTEPTPPER